MHAAGGVIATAPDLARFLVAELNAGKVDGKQLLPADVVARSQQDQVSLDEKYQDFQRTGYGWGWYSGQYMQRRMLHHFGGFAGYHAHLSFMPDAGIALVVLNNEDMLAGRLSLPKQAYTGSFHGELLGDMEVSLDQEGRLRLRWGRVASVATGSDQPEQVRVEFVPNSGQVVSFMVEGEQVTGLTFSGMRFDRQR